MIKRIVVAGSRHYNDYNQAKECIEKLIKNIKKEYELVFVSGCCKGADKIGERFAQENGFKTEYYPAQWEKYGLSAGPKRNMQMAQISDYVICFWDGKSKGTYSMIRCCKKLNKNIRIIKI